MFVTGLRHWKYRGQLKPKVGDPFQAPTCYASAHCPTVLPLALSCSLLLLLLPLAPSKAAILPFPIENGNLQSQVRGIYNIYIYLLLKEIFKDRMMRVKQLKKGFTKHTPLFTTLTPPTYYINAPRLLHIHSPPIGLAATQLGLAAQ